MSMTISGPMNEMRPRSGKVVDLIQSRKPAKVYAVGGMRTSWLSKTTAQPARARRGGLAVRWAAVLAVWLRMCLSQGSEEFVLRLSILAGFPNLFKNGTAGCLRG